MQYAQLVPVIRLGLVCGVILASSSLLGQDSKEKTPPDTEPSVEYKTPPPRLGPPPSIDVDTTRYPATKEEQTEIDTLIDQLAQIGNPDYGMARGMAWCQFPPFRP